jgi:hypothetical protein
MSPVDLEAAVAWMEARWGFQKLWSGWEGFYEDFAPFSAGALKEALHGWFNMGNRFAPKPAELRAGVAVASARRVEAGTDVFDRSCHGLHRWADPSPFDEDRHRECVLCGEPGVAMKCEHQASVSGRCVYCPETVGV